MPRLLYYDPDLKRQFANVGQLLAASKNGLEIEAVSRLERWPGERCAEDLLLQEPFPYAAVIVPSVAQKWAEFVEAANVSLELQKLPPGKVYCLYAKNLPGCEHPINFHPANNGNGYLSQKEASDLVARIVPQINKL